MNNGNGNQVRSNSGTSGDMFAAYVSRTIVIGALAYIAITATQGKEGVQDLKRDALDLKNQATEDRKQIQEIKDGMKKFATKEEMNAESQRIQAAFTEQLKHSAKVANP